jgi:hypothetical protein
MEQSPKGRGKKRALRKVCMHEAVQGSGVNRFIKKQREEKKKKTYQTNE